MRIHSDIFTGSSFTDALRSAGLTDEVRVEDLSLHNSRKRACGFEVRLAASEGRDRNGKARRPRMTGRYGSENAPDYVKAATYDEHGYWIAELFKIDPEAIIGPYKGVENFNELTRYAYC